MTKGRRTGPPPAASRPASTGRSTSGHEPEVEVADVDGPSQFRGVTVDRMFSFLRVYEAKGIASAAPRDPVRQSQLSRQVRELETTLDAELFGRRGRGIEATPAGVAFAATIRDFFNGLARVRTAQRVPIQLSAGGSVLRWLVLPLLPMPVRPGGEPFPPIMVEPGDSGSIHLGLEDGSLDLGILRATEVKKPLAGTAIGEVEYAWFCARSLVPEAPEATPSALGAAAPLVDIYGEPDLDALFSELGTPVISCESFRESAELIRAGRCAGVLPVFAARELPASEFHIVRPKAFAKYASRLMLAHRPREETTDPELSRLRGYLRDALKNALDQAQGAGRVASQASAEEKRSAGPTSKPRGPSRKGR
jgi:DNA-binding transcriptional LysR family regulator